MLRIYVNWYKPDEFVILIDHTVITRFLFIDGYFLPNRRYRLVFDFLIDVSQPLLLSHRMLSDPLQHITTQTMIPEQKLGLPAVHLQ